jgi:16S rRNA (uracil1498-N3)-methyltransferase
MQLFYSNIAQSVGQTLSIEGQEHVHLAKSLRKQTGDVIQITNGKGLIFNAEVLMVSKNATSAKIIDVLREDKPTSKIYLAAAPTKNIDRYEWMLEKSIELGLGGLFPFVSQNSERRILKTDKLKLQAVGAMKQSLQSFLPEVHELQNFKEMLQSVAHFEVKLIAYSSESKLSLQHALKKDKSTIVLIGPEGGFTEKELNLALEHGFEAIALGKNRLRTETAGVYATAIYYSMYEN